MHRVIKSIGLIACCLFVLPVHQVVAETESRSSNFFFQKGSSSSIDFHNLYEKMRVTPVFHFWKKTDTVVYPISQELVYFSHESLRLEDRYKLLKVDSSVSFNVLIRKRTQFRFGKLIYERFYATPQFFFEIRYTP